MSYPLLHWVPASQDGRDVDEDEGKADEQHLEVAVDRTVDPVVVTNKNIMIKLFIE